MDNSSKSIKTLNYIGVGNRQCFIPGQHMWLFAARVTGTVEATVNTNSQYSPNHGFSVELGVRLRK